MTGDRNINLGSGNYNERIEGDYIQGNYYNAPQKQNLAQAAAEIQELLEQLDTEYDRTDYPQPIVDRKVQQRKFKQLYKQQKG